jgi:hypothetical protein
VPWQAVFEERWYILVEDHDADILVEDHMQNRRTWCDHVEDGHQHQNESNILIPEGAEVQVDA